MRHNVNIVCYVNYNLSNAKSGHSGPSEHADNQHLLSDDISLPFTGKEKDSETGYYYFGARYYDPSLSGLFLSVDPMSDKFPSISPYAYCAWNPVTLVDPDVKTIWIVDLDGNKEKYVVDMAPNRNSQYISNTINVLNKLSETETIGDKILQLSYIDHFSIEVIESDGETVFKESSYEGMIDVIPQNQSILFDSSFGILEIATGKVMSPALCLGHEFGHLLSLIEQPEEYFKRRSQSRNDVWDNEEEWYNITHYEHGIAKEWDELVRDGHNTLDYNGNEKYRVINMHVTIDNEKKD